MATARLPIYKKFLDTQFTTPIEWLNVVIKETETYHHGTEKRRFYTWFNSWVEDVPFSFAQKYFIAEFWYKGEKFSRNWEIGYRYDRDIDIGELLQCINYDEVFRAISNYNRNIT